MQGMSKTFPVKNRPPFVCRLVSFTLTRNVGEAIMIGDKLIVKILGASGSQARIGVDAPQDVEIHREEIYQQIQDERSEVDLVPYA